MSPDSPTPFEIADELTEAYADISPLAASFAGVSGRDHLLDDFSPEGQARHIDLLKQYQTRLQPLIDYPDPDQANAAKVITAWIEERVAAFEDGKWKRDIGHVHGPFVSVRQLFEIMPTDGVEAWDNIVSRFNGFGAAMDGYRQSLQLGLDEGSTAAQRQVRSLIDQARHSAGDESAFLRYVAKAETAGYDSQRVEAAVRNARSAAGELADWLESTYLPRARMEDPVGRERYLLGADEFLGMRIDPDETYGWGWQEVHRLRSEMVATAAEIDPDKDVEGVIEMLDTDPARASEDHQSFAEFVKEIQAEAVEQLAGEHFDVPDQLREVDVNIAPPGGALGAWYIPPSEDFARSGSIWYAPGEKIKLPYWQEVSTAYHEGFPGHHLQVGIAMLSKERMSRFHRMFIWYSGAGEGWALYAERLMDELGYFEKPEYRLGLLASQLFRATRVVVDIGTQLELELPEHAPLYPGHTWNFEIAVDYMEKVGLQRRDLAESEVLRYLGWWGQAIAYKVGEREILSIRRRVMEDEGPSFDRKDFHRRVLEAGAIRLDHLWEALV